VRKERDGEREMERERDRNERDGAMEGIIIGRSTKAIRHQRVAIFNH